MKDNNLLEILVKWNFWDKKVIPGFPREATKNIINYLKGPEIISLKGVRRSGKSTILFQIIDTLLSQGIEPRDILFINFEEPLFFQQRESTILDRLYAIYRERVNPGRFAYVFLDEVQEFPGWEKWVRAKTDLKEAKIFVTGSSSRLLTAEFGTLLTGRHISFTIYPLSFKEFLRFKGAGKIFDSVVVSGEKSLIKNLLHEYMQFGGFPEVVLKEHHDLKDKLLKQYFEDIVYRDIVSRYKVRDITTLKNIALFYMTNISSLSAYNRIKNTLHVPLEVARKYSGYLVESFLVKEVMKHSFKVREQLRNPKKVYAIDPGMRNAVSYRFSQDMGRIAENIVFLTLLQQEKEVYYFKEHGEVDFLARKGMSPESLIQVCMADEECTAWEREMRSLDDALQATELKRGLMITENREEIIPVKSGEIRAVPFWKWLLEID